jgi:hypothetical protein
LVAFFFFFRRSIQLAVVKSYSTTCGRDSDEAWRYFVGQVVAVEQHLSKQADVQFLIVIGQQQQETQYH